jgi:hypothetical protein
VAVAAEALAEHLGIYAEAGPDGLVFPAERGGPIREPLCGQPFSQVTLDRLALRSQD